MRPEIDPFVEILSTHLQELKQYHTWDELTSYTWVSKGTLMRYAKCRGRYIRSDTLRGILRIFGLQLRIE